MNSRKEQAGKIVTAPMGAGSTTGRGEVSYLCHAVELDVDGSPCRVLCGKAKPEHILDDSSLFNAYPTDCKGCAAKLRKLKIVIEITDATGSAD